MNIENLKTNIGFGIAGNFANHLSQAGEMQDFANIKTIKDAPKGIFPVYLPNSDTFLGLFPLSNNKLFHPRNNENLQMEPEVVLFCDIKYQNNKVVNITPKYFSAYNDATIRKQGVDKISKKKNWGENTKGISEQLIKIDTFESKSIMDNYKIVSFIKRDNKLNMYGEDSNLNTYSYFYTKLQKWIINTLNTQQKNSPLENISLQIKDCNYPKEMFISIGATRYTHFGENNYLQLDDKCFVFVYDKTKYCLEDIKKIAKNEDIKNKKDISILCQVVI